MAEWTIAVHGGAKEIPEDQMAAHLLGCERALLAGQSVLESGGAAVEAVEAAIRVLESDATFNAGYGSEVNADGEVECDAAVMDGESLDVGAVGAIMGVRHPVSVAAAMLREEPTLLVGAGAARFARDSGAELCDPAELMVEREEHSSDTVGCVAMDSTGALAAGTSTGGLHGSPPGRVGDSPLPGCGLFAENGVGAVALSGDGESITRVALGGRVMHELRAGDAHHSVDVAIHRLSDVDGEAGLIVIDSNGRIDWNHNSRDFVVAHATSTRPVKSFIRREEDTTL